MVVNVLAAVLLALAGTAAAADKLFLWEVQGERANLHLLGTVHVWKKESYPLPEPVEQAFKSARVLAVEVDPRSIEFDGRLVQRAFYSRDDSLDRHLPDLMFDEVNRAAKELGLDLRAVRQSKPWFLGSMLTAVAASRSGYGVDSGIDAYLVQKAGVERKRIVELESIEMQLDLFEGIPQDLQTLFVKQALELTRGDIAKKFFDELAAAWNDGDAVKMDAWLRRILEEDPLGKKFFDSILASRNPAMAEKIIQLLEGEGPVFVAVGVGHLVGSNSIIDLLTARGYVVRQLMR